jgi:hypothetical protein
MFFSITWKRNPVFWLKLLFLSSRIASWCNWQYRLEIWISPVFALAGLVRTKHIYPSALNQTKNVLYYHWYKFLSTG